MTRRLAAIALALHGVFHVIGFVVPWRFADVESIPYRTTAFGGRLELGDVGIRLLGAAWLVLAVAFIVIAAGAWQGRQWAWSATLVAAAASLVLCVAGSPDAVYGILVNAVILAVVARYAAEHQTVLNPLRHEIDALRGRRTDGGFRP
jgi:hypothetical protein